MPEASPRTGPGKQTLVKFALATRFHLNSTLGAMLFLYSSVDKVRLLAVPCSRFLPTISDFFCNNDGQSSGEGRGSRHLSCGSYFARDGLGEGEKGEGGIGQFFCISFMSGSCRPRIYFSDLLQMFARPALGVLSLFCHFLQELFFW